MKRLKTLNIIQLIFNIVIVLTEVAGFIVGFTGLAGGKLVLANFRFYTVLTATVTLVASLLMICPNIIGIKKQKDVTPRFFFILRYIAAVMNILTFLTVAIFLRSAEFPGTGTVDLLFSLAGGCLFMHFVCPLLSMILFMFFEITPKLRFKNVFIPFLVTVTYAVVILITIAVMTYGVKDTKMATDFAPYFFFLVFPQLDPNYLRNLGVAGIVLVSSLVISFVAWVINRITSSIVIGYTLIADKVNPNRSKNAKVNKVKEEEDTRNVYHISYSNRSDKTWKVKSEGAQRAIKIFPTQKAAIEYANGQVKLHGGSIRIHSMVGRIRKEW